MKTTFKTSASGRVDNSGLPGYRDIGVETRRPDRLCEPFATSGTTEQVGGAMEGTDGDLFGYVGM
jgi:hypothetical protein